MNSYYTLETGNRRHRVLPWTSKVTPKVVRHTTLQCFVVQLQIKKIEVDPRLCIADQPVRYHKRPFTSTLTNKAWTELAEEKKASMKKEKLEGDIRLQKALLEESDLRKEKLKIEIELLKLELK